MSKILGLDVGDSKIGVAMSDTLGWVAQGITTFRRQNMQQDLGYLRKLIQEHNIKEVVVGLPVKKMARLTRRPKKFCALPASCASISRSRCAPGTNALPPFRPAKFWNAAT